MSSPALPPISPENFFTADLRIGTVTRVEPFPQARKPAYQIWVDFGPTIGTLATSAQVTQLYTPQTLLGQQVVGWVNAPPKQIGPFLSQFLLLGAHTAHGAVVLLQPAQTVPHGARVC